MNATLKLELPFYVPDTIALFSRPIVSDLLGNEFPQAALKFTMERTR